MLLDLVKGFLSTIRGSKKATGLVLGLIFLLAASLLKKINVEVTDEEKQLAIGLLSVYLGAQGLADIGKEKAKIEASNSGSDPEPEDDGVKPDPDAPRAG